jgi:DNA-binding response OmpR family regulator
MTTRDVMAGKRVLLAEDDDSARRAMGTVLRALGLDVLETSDGGRMLVALGAHYQRERSPQELDLIVTDLNMPVIGGLDVFKGLRAAGWTVPVLIVTGNDSDEVRGVAARLDAVVLAKPIDLQEFERAVLALLSRPRRPALARPASAPPARVSTAGRTK